MGEITISSIIGDKEGIELNALKGEKTTTLSLQSAQSLLTATADKILEKAQESIEISVKESKININEKSIEISIGNSNYIKIEDGKIELSCNGNSIELGEIIKINGNNINISSSQSVNVKASQEIALKAMSVSAS